MESDSRRVSRHGNRLFGSAYVLPFCMVLHFDRSHLDYRFFLCALALRPNAGHGLLNLEVSRSHTTKHHSRWDSSGRVISSTQRPVPDNTQHPNRQISMPPVGFEPTISAGERPQTYALDREATGTGSQFQRITKNFKLYRTLSSFS